MPKLKLITAEDLSNLKVETIGEYEFTSLRWESLPGAEMWHVRHDNFHNRFHLIGKVVQTLNGYKALPFASPITLRTVVEKEFATKHEAAQFLHAWDRFN